MDKDKTKQSDKKNEQKNLPVKYIRQPYPISAMQADLSRQQIRILVGMMQSVQEGVQAMFENEHRRDGQLVLFPDLQGDRVHIDFKFKDVVDRPDAYRNVEAIANKFMQMVFRYEDKEKGEVTLTHFVDKITYPQRGSKRDKIRFTFTREQAEAVFNFTMYSRYLQHVATAAENKYTARLYMLITSARGFDKDHTGVFHWYVGYVELRRMLGCDDKDEQGRWYRKSQKLYKHFKRDILRTAEAELKSLADDGKSDCWFEFVELPEDRTGDPERFDFIVHLSEMGKIESMRMQNNATAKELVRFMQEEWLMTERQALTIINSIDLNRIDAFAEEVHAIAQRINAKGDAVNNRTSYAEECLQTAAEQFKPSDNANLNNPSAPATPKEPSPRINADLHTLKQNWIEVVGMKNYKMFLVNVDLEWSGTDVVALVDHECVKEFMEKEGLEKFGVNEVRVKTTN